MKLQFTEKETELREQFETKIEEIKRKCSDDLNSTRAEMITKLKQEYGKVFFFFFVFCQSNDKLMKLTGISVALFPQQNPNMRNSKRTKKKNNKTCNETTNAN